MISLQATSEDIISTIDSKMSQSACTRAYVQYFSDVPSDEIDALVKPVDIGCTAADIAKALTYVCIYVMVYVSEETHKF
jgi:hypothetical protein